jgi:hypothetical protein
MHPTTEEQLTAVRRLLDEVAADPGVSEASRRALTEAGRRLRRIERSGAARLPFLVRDNRECLALLGQLEPLAPGLAGPLPVIDDADEHHEPRAHELNKRLRGLLATAARRLPDKPGADAWRARLAAHLLRRIATDPALNRPGSLAP